MKHENPLISSTALIQFLLYSQCATRISITIKVLSCVGLRKMYCTFVYKFNGINNKTISLLYFVDKKKKTTTKYLAKILIFIKFQKKNSLKCQQYTQ